MLPSSFTRAANSPSSFVAPNLPGKVSPKYSVKVYIYSYDRSLHLIPLNVLVLVVPANRRILPHHQLYWMPYLCLKPVEGTDVLGDIAWNDCDWEVVVNGLTVGYPISGVIRCEDIEPVVRAWCLP